MKINEMKKKKTPRWPDYEVVKLPEGTITFGTTLFMRKDKRALRIIFPAGQSVTFCPQDEIDKVEAINKYREENLPTLSLTRKPRKNGLIKIQTNPLSPTK